MHKAADALNKIQKYRVGNLHMLLYFYAAFALTEYRIFSLQAMAADGILIPKQRCRQKWLENAGMERVCGIGYTQRD